MNALDILSEGYYDDFRSSLDNALAMAHAKGITSISVDKLVSMLYRMGYSTTKDAIESELSNSVWVTTMDGSNIGIGDQPADMTADQSRDRVEDLASTAAGKVR